MDSLLKWVPALIVMVAGLIFCFRMLKRGLGTLETYKTRHLEHIHAQEQEIHENRKNIPRDERLRLARSAIADLLHLEGDRPGFSLSTQGSGLLLQTPDDDWLIILDMREQRLHSTRKVLHGGVKWFLKGRDYEENFSDLAGLMRSLTAILRGVQRLEPTPTALTRRKLRRHAAASAKKKFIPGRVR